jgi:elongation factor 1-gamma
LADDKTLLGKSEQDYAQIIRWISLANAELLPTSARAFKPIIGALPYNKKQVSDNTEALDLIASVFESRLSEFTYLVGERLTLADLFAASTTFRAFQYLWGAEWRAQHPSITRWFSTVISHPILAPAFADFQFIENPVEYTPPKKEKKPAAVPAPAAKKEEKKPAAPAEDAAPAEEKKPKHPLELLGKSTKFNLDEWKRTYSNEETREVALPWFWEHYDPTEWSLWRVDYKYNDELTLTFMSNNLLGGFFNRLSASTKYLFGSGIVYGENNNNGIVGVFLVRGQEHEPAFNVAPDWESYSFSKLDASNTEVKEFVNDIFAWDKPLTINGETREVADGKVFK